MFPIVLPAFCRCVGLAQRGSPTPQLTSDARSVDQMIEGYEKVPWSAERCVLPLAYEGGADALTFGHAP